MTDIVERLRNYIPGENGDEVQDRISEAADEIVRLRDALTELSNTIEDMKEIALLALTPADGGTGISALGKTER